MIFASTDYIVYFLPAAFIGYFILNKLRLFAIGKMWLVACSLVFYSYWSAQYLPLLLGSILFNYLAGNAIGKMGTQSKRKALLAISIAANLILLGYYKYAIFFAENLGALTGQDFSLGAVALPLGISFFTFTQIAYLVDAYRAETEEYNLINYALFVTFFPHLIAGPILHHKEMMSQFQSRWRLNIRTRYIVAGIFIFSVGLAKKVLVADTFAIWANHGYDGPHALSFTEAWVTSLSYTFQLYFDFSGYSDMAIGSALLFNIWLPINFNSPYKALTIQDFWRRWHMTLSRFLRDYLYIPLGGNRAAPMQIYLNLLITFVLGGLWHGASWMFVIWGALHGSALIIHRVWSRVIKVSLHPALAWLITFNFVNVTWIFFRAHDWQNARRVLAGMLDVRSIDIGAVPTVGLAWAGWFADVYYESLPSGLASHLLPLAALSVGFVLLPLRNSTELMVSGVNTTKMVWAAFLFGCSFIVINATASTVFLYYNF